MNGYSSINEDGVIVFEFTGAPLGSVPRANGIIATCKECKRPGELRSGTRKKNGKLHEKRGGASMICIHRATATPIPKLPGEYTVVIDDWCEWRVEPAPAAHAGLFGGEGNLGLFRRGRQYG